MQIILLILRILPQSKKGVQLMVAVYVTLIINGRRKFSDVPKKLQSAVKAELNAMGLDENGNPLEIGD